MPTSAPRTPDDGALADAAAAELATPRPPFGVDLQPATALQIVGLLQLAARHPSVTAVHHATIARFVAGVTAYFADCPAVCEIIRRGDDPTEDR